MIWSVLQILMVNQYKNDKDSCMLELGSKEEGICDLVSVRDPYGEPIQEGQVQLYVRAEF